MKSILAVVTAGIAMAAAVCADAAPESATPLSIYGRLPNVEQVEISPDGTKLAIAITDGEKRLLVIREATEALKKAGKPVELVTLPSEDHWLSRGATRLQMLTSVVGFLEKNNPPNWPNGRSP